MELIHIFIVFIYCVYIRAGARNSTRMYFMVSAGPRIIISPGSQMVEGINTLLEISVLLFCTIYLTNLMLIYVKKAGLLLFYFWWFFFCAHALKSCPPPPEDFRIVSEFLKIHESFDNFRHIIHAHTRIVFRYRTIMAAES